MLELGFRVTGLHFFEAGSEAPSFERRAYKRRFARSEARFIYWQLNLEHRAPGQVLDVAIVAVYTGPQGDTFARDILDAQMQPDWTSSYWYKGWGWADAGHWPVGTYIVDIYVEGTPVAHGTFDIV